MEQVGVQFIAAGGDVYITTVKNATTATNTFVDATEKGGGRVSGAGQVMIGALRQVGAMAVQAFEQAAKATAAFVSDSVKVAGDFEAGMHRFQAVAGDAVDTKGLQKFHDLFIQLGKELPVSTSEVEQAAIEMVSGGIDPAIVAAGGLRQTIQFAAAANLNLGESAATAAKFLAGWTKTSATAAEKVLFLATSEDALVKAAAASSTTAKELRLGLFNVQGAAQALGVSFTDTTATLALLAPAFESSAQAGTALNVFMTRLVPQTDKARAAMKDLGLITKSGQNVFFDAQGTFLGMGNAAEQLKQKLGGLTDEQKIDTLHQLFGNDAMKVGNLLMQDGAKGLENMIAKMEAANGVSATAALMQSGYNTALENAKGSVEALQIRIGEFLIPVLTDLLNNYVAPGINAITDFAESFFKMVPAIMASDDPLQTFLNALKIAAPGLFDFIVAIEDIKDAITPTIQEIMRLADALSTGGIGGLIDAVVGDIEAALPGIEDALLEWGQAFIDWIAPMIPPLIDEIADLASAAWDWIVGEAPKWGAQLEAWGDELVAWIAPMIPPALAELARLGDQFLGWIGDQAAPLLQQLNDWAVSFVAWIPGATVKFLAEWPKMFDEFLNWIGKSAGPLLKQLGDWALAFVEWIIPMIPGFLVTLGAIALAATTFIGETALVLANKILYTWVPALVGWIVKDAIPGIYKALESLWKSIQDWILDVEQDLAKKMRNVGESMVQGIQKGLNDAWHGLLGWFGDKASELYDYFMAKIKGGSPALVFVPAGESVVQGLMKGLSDMWPSLTALVGTMADDLIKQAASIAEQVQDAIGDAFGATASIDRQMAKNLESLSKMEDGFYKNATENALRSAAEQAKAFADPAVGAKYYKMRSQQIFEFQDLQANLAKQQQALNDANIQQTDEMAKSDELRAQIAVAATDEERAALQKKLDASLAIQDADIRARAEARRMIEVLQQQQILILKAQEAEQSAFDATNSRTSSATKDLIAEIGLLFNNPHLQDLQKQLSEAKTDKERARIQQLINEASIPVNDTGLGHDLMELLRQLEIQAGTYTPPPGSEGYTPPPTAQQMPPTSGTKSFSSTRTFNMPIYTNQSPTVVVDSLAIANAVLP